MANFDDIIQEINTNLPDNNAQLITAKKLRDTLIDFTEVTEEVIPELINNRLNGSEVQILPEYTNHIVISSANIWVYDANYTGYIFPVSEGAKYIISNNSATYTTTYAFLTDNSQVSGETPHYAGGETSRIEVPIGTSKLAIVPSDATYMFVYLGRSNVGIFTRISISGEIPEIQANINTINNRIDKIEEVIPESEEIVPQFEIGAISNNVGNIINSTFYDEKVWIYNRFIKVGNNTTITLNSNQDNIYGYLMWYREDYSYISNDYKLLSISNSVTYNVPDNAYYFKIKIQNNTNASLLTNISEPIIKVKGKFSKNDWSSPNPRPADGYIGLLIPVRVFNPTATDEITDSVQDSKQILADYGVLALPEQYEPEGKPTRLIIYCHGAAVNYSAGANRFDAQDLNPDYWLSEGYAVMDIEGNPFDNTMEHFGIPQAYQCYKAAYEYVIRNYNICKDGIFLGGRSMGGLMTLDIIGPERDIPVIAACPNVPCIIPTWYFTYCNAARRTFIANHMGFVNQPTWTASNPMNTAEWNCIRENFVKLASFSPFYKLLVSLPSFNDILDNTNVSTTDATAFQNVYGDCRIKFKVPTKLFIALDDTVAIPAMNGLLLEQLAEQSGQLFVTRKFNSGGHHYDTQNPDLQVTVTNSFGQSITTSVVYVEMLAWWKQWEQNLR